MDIPEEDFGISQKDLFTIWTAGILFGLLHNNAPAPDSPHYDEEMDEYARGYQLLLDVNEFRVKLGIEARNYSREDNETLSILFGARLIKRQKLVDRAQV